MPADFLINPEHKVVFSYAWGTLTFKDIKAHRGRLWEDANFATDLRQIAMLSDAIKLKFTSDEIWSLATQPVLARESHRAVVAAPNLHFGLSRMFDSFSNDEAIGVFRTLD